MSQILLENCNRCCADGPEYQSDSTEIVCENCGFSQSFEIWQIRGWRSLAKYPPTYPGPIYVYGRDIGRVIAEWDSVMGVCSNALATHWLRVPDPRVQVGML